MMERRLAGRKAVVVSKVFLFASAAVIGILLLTLGLRFIKDIKSASEEATLLQFKSKLKEDIDTVRTKTAKRIISYQAPVGTTEICVLDQRARVDDLASHPFMQDALRDQTKINLFIYGPDDVDHSYMPRLGVMSYPYFACMPVDMGNVELELIGKKNQAWVLPPPDEDFCSIAEDSKPSTCELLDAIYAGYSAKCCQIYEKCC